MGVMEKVPTLTVGLPVYNGAKYLEAAAASILSQSFRDLELIISDNASTDGTETIGRALAARDNRVTYRRNRSNIGLSGNFNLLVPLARGRLFKWATSDDLLRPGYLERCVAAVDADPSVVLAYSQTGFVDSEGGPLDCTDPGWHLESDAPADRLLYAILADHYVNAVLGVIRIDALRATRLMPRYGGGDYRLMAELSLLGKFVEVPEQLYVRRIHEGSSAGNVGDRRWLRRYWGGVRSGLHGAYWRLSFDRAWIVARAPISPGRKVHLLSQLTWCTLGHWRRLLVEVADVLPHVPP